MSTTSPTGRVSTSRSRPRGYAPGPNSRGASGCPTKRGATAELQFVGESLAHELGVDLAAPFDHEAAHPPYVVKVFQKHTPVECGSGRDDVHADESLQQGGRPQRALVRRVDDLLAARVPELGPRVELTGTADGDLQGVFGAAAGDTGRTPFGGVDQEPRIVRAQGAGAHQDRVAGRPHLVDPVEVGRAREQQPLGAGVVQEAVEGDGGGQQDVGTGHRDASSGRTRAVSFERSGSSFKQYLDWSHDDPLAHRRRTARLALVPLRGSLLEDAIDRRLQAEAGMPHLYYSILAKLSEAPERRLRMTDLAEAQKITRSR